MKDDDWAGKVLSFWFEELKPEDWYTGSDALDASIRKRFGAIHDRLKKGPPGSASANSRTALAAIIVLDQFSRNMFRGRAAAFATDDIAARLARQAIDNGLDDKLSEQECQFLYMPLMHSESMADQERCVMLFASILEGANLKYAVEHRDIIARFGRFPHRNRALGRKNTAEEEKYLKSAKGFGQ